MRLRHDSWPCHRRYRRPELRLDTPRGTRSDSRMRWSSRNHLHTLVSPRHASPCSRVEKDLSVPPLPCSILSIKEAGTSAHPPYGVFFPSPDRLDVCQVAYACCHSTRTSKLVSILEAPQPYHLAARSAR